MDSAQWHCGRRSFLAVIPATMLLAACAKSAKSIDEGWAVSGTAADAIDHSAWDALLAKYVKPAADGVNRVDYAAIKAQDLAALQHYLAALQAVDIQQYAKDEQFAFWVNLYNAATVALIVKKYPVDSIREIGALGLGPWGDKLLKVSGKALSLDDIEHGILRPIWKDVRIHYAVNCASIGCPNLARQAFTAERLEPMLEAAARDYINHPRGFARVDGRLVASNIFDWYVADWGNQAGVLDHARQYATDATKAVLGDATKIDRHGYDWSLNDAA